MNKLANYYNTNTKFHSFVQGLIGALIGASASWGSGAPTGKAGWIALASFVGKALFSWYTRWAQTQDTVVPVSTPAQAAK